MFLDQDFEYIQTLSLDLVSRIADTIRRDMQNYLLDLHSRILSRYDIVILSDLLQ